MFLYYQDLIQIFIKTMIIFKMIGCKRLIMHITKMPINSSKYFISTFMETNCLTSFPLIHHSNLIIPTNNKLFYSHLFNTQYKYCQFSVNYNYLVFLRTSSKCTWEIIKICKVFNCIRKSIIYIFVGRYLLFYLIQIILSALVIFGLTSVTRISNAKKKLHLGYRSNADCPQDYLCGTISGYDIMIIDFPY